MVAKTFLSERGYALLKKLYDADILNQVRDELTVSPRVIDMGLGLTPPTFKLFRESNNKLYLPSKYGLKKFGIPDVDKIGCEIEEFQQETNPESEFYFNGTLREIQKEAINGFKKALNDPLKRGGIINARCAFGKTCSALNIISRLKCKTLIIAHKNFLLEQWRDRIAQFLPNMKVGIIQAQKIDYLEYNVVLGSLQSLAMKNYDAETFKDFHFVVIDEIHRTGSEVFSQAYLKLSPKYTLGLSATLQRKDNLTKVFKWFIGDVCFKTDGKNKDIINVNVYNYNSKNPDYNTIPTIFNGKVNMSRMLNNVCYFKERNKEISNIIIELLQKDPTRVILIQSDRREQLRTIKEILEKEYADLSVGYYVGGMKQSVLDEVAENCQVILSTYGLAAEGLDIVRLDTCILASPKTSIEQSVGRILRKKPEDRINVPLVIDIVDQFSLFPNQFKKRLAFYNKNKYKIDYFNIGDYSQEEEYDSEPQRERGVMLIDPDSDGD